MTLITGAQGIFTGLPGDAMRASGTIRIRDGRIAAVGALKREPDEAVIDATGCVVYPGLVSTHHHLFQCVLKGVRAGIDVPLLAWLRAVPYSYWQKLGIRLVFCRGGATKARKFDTPDLVPTPAEPLDKMITSVEACAQRYHDPSSDSTRRVAFAPTTPPWSLEPEELKTVASAARHMHLRIHGHLSETLADVDFCLANFGKRPVQWMADHDYLGGDVWLAHLVHLDDEEMRILAETGTGMAHCPQSNCRLGSGIAPAERLAALGGAVSLAVDGAASNESADMISEMHSAWHTHRAVKGAGAVAVEDVVRWASANGARVLGFEDGGVIAPGKLADLAIFDLSHPRYFGLHDPLIGPVACAGEARLRHLIVGGRLVVNDGAIPGLGLAQLRHDAARVVARLAS